MRPLHGKYGSLNVLVPWLRLLGHLGTELKLAALPALVECPACRERTLQVLPDHWGGEWFSCDTCGKSGDGIEFAAWVWKLTVPATIHKLSRDGFDIPTDEESIRRYINHYVKRRNNFTTLWEQSRRSHLHNSTSLSRLVHDLRFHSEVPASRRDAGPGQLFGCVDKGIARSTYLPKAKPKKRLPGGAYSIFPGIKGSELLFMPFRDMPGRISGFYFIGGDGTTKERLFRAVNYERRRPEDAGLFFHPDAFAVSEHHWNNVVFALADPVMAVQLHARHFETSTLPLPIFVWHEKGVQPGGAKKLVSNAGTQHSWNMLARHQIVFWMPKLDPVVMRRAAAVNGLISMQGPKKYTRQALQQYLWQRNPTDMLRHLASTAQPWVDIFASAVNELTEGMVEQLTLEIVRSDYDIPRLLNHLPEGPREKLRGLLAKTTAVPQISFQRETIFEKHGMWHVNSSKRPGEETIFNGILRVDHIVYHKRTGASYLEGRLIANGSVVPFCDDEARIKKNPLEWVRNLARSKGGMLVDGKQAWNNRLLEIAYAFHEPKYVTGADIVGWDTDSARFVLPTYSIHLGGRVEPALTDLLSADVPATKLTRPAKLSPEDFNAVSTDTSMSRTFWACLAPLVSNVLAPAFALNPSGIALVGGAARWAGLELSQAIGCQQRTIPPTHISRVMDSIYDAEFVHNWPLFVGNNEPVQWGRWWGYWANKRDHTYRNCVVAMSEIAGMIKAAQGGWHVVVAGKEFMLPPTWKTLAAKFVPAYLHDLAQRNLRWRAATSTPTWLGDVLRDMSDFVEHIGADPAIALAASEHLWPDTEYGHARAFAHVLGSLHRDGQLLIAPEGFQRGDRICLVRRPEGLFIPDIPLREHLMSRHYLLAEHQAVSKALSLENALITDEEDGWVVDDSWWSQAQRNRPWPYTSSSPPPQPRRSSASIDAITSS